MIYFIQLIRMLNKEQRKLFIELFDDLSFEINDLGYGNVEDELINEMLANHLGMDFADQRQLDMFTAYILKNQGRMEAAVKRADIYLQAHNF